MIPSLLIVTFLVYVACRIGFNPVASYSRSNPRASQAKIDQFIAENGLYPGIKGYIRGYFEWLGKFLRGPEYWPKSIVGQGAVWGRCATPSSTRSVSPEPRRCSASV